MRPAACTPRRSNRSGPPSSPRTFTTPLRNFLPVDARECGAEVGYLRFVPEVRYLRSSSVADRSRSQ
eukprot:4108955-Prymnesium_polylepis.1